MLKRLENKLRMFNTVKLVLDRYPDVWQAITAMTAIVNEFVEQLAGINQTRMITEAELTGSTKDKNLVEDQLIDGIYGVASSLSTYATRTGDTILQNKTMYKESYLKSYREGELTVIGDTISGLARQNLAGLADYGVDEAEIAALETVNTKFKTLIAAPQANISERKAANEKLKDQFNETSLLLESQMDPMMVRFKAGAPEFYSGYQNARMIVDLGMRHGSNGGTEVPQSEQEQE
jgi:hypothetical protein